MSRYPSRSLRGAASSVHWPPSRCRLTWSWLDKRCSGPYWPSLGGRPRTTLLTQANGTEYALGAGIWGSDLSRVMTLARSLRTGIAWVNTYGALPVGAAFGGVGASGFGRDNAIETMQDYQYVKSIVVNLRGKPMPMY